MIHLEDVSFNYPSGRALEGVSLRVAPGEILGIAGPNSAGKTTLLRLLSKVLLPQEGRICLLGRDLRGLSRLEVARTVAVVPQELSSAFPYTALQVVLMGRYPFSDGLRFDGQEDIALARQVLAATGAEALAPRYLHELSGGERQRVSIAKALAQRTPILLLDEPTAHLDLRYQVEIAQLLLRLHREEGLTMLIVSHDLNLVSDCCQRLLLLKEGRVYRLGAPEEVIDEKTIGEVYGCRARVEEDPATGRPRVILSYRDEGLRAS